MVVAITTHPSAVNNRQKKRFDAFKTMGMKKLKYTGNINDEESYKVFILNHPSNLNNRSPTKHMTQPPSTAVRGNL